MGLVSLVWFNHHSDKSLQIEVRFTQIGAKSMRIIFRGEETNVDFAEAAGKEFVNKKNNPIAINLKHGNLKEQIEKACESALFFLGIGTCSVVKVAKLSIGTKEIAENIMAAINGLGDSVPGTWKNVKLFHVKLLESLALPVYQSEPRT